MSGLFSRLAFIAVATWAILAVPMASADESLAVRFQGYPDGIWKSEVLGSRNGRSFGPSQQVSSCSKAPSDAAVRKFLSSINEPRPGCEVTVYINHETTLEWMEQCQVGEERQTTHMTVQRLDDHTLEIESRVQPPGFDESYTHVLSIYQGACPAADESADVPVACSAIDAQRGDLNDANDQCQFLPDTLRGNCTANVANQRKNLARLEASCKRQAPTAP